MFEFELTVTDLAWSSDWNGDEVGYPDIEIVGLYTREGPNGTENYYIDMENMILLETWTDSDDL